MEAYRNSLLRHHVVGDAAMASVAVYRQQVEALLGRDEEDYPLVVDAQRTPNGGITPEPTIELRQLGNALAVVTAQRRLVDSRLRIKPVVWIEVIGPRGTLDVSVDIAMTVASLRAWILLNLPDSEGKTAEIEVLIHGPVHALIRPADQELVCTILEQLKGRISAISYRPAESIFEPGTRHEKQIRVRQLFIRPCLLYTSDAADE